MYLVVKFCWRLFPAILAAAFAYARFQRKPSSDGSDVDEESPTVSLATKVVTAASPSQVEGEVNLVLPVAVSTVCGAGLTVGSPTPWGVGEMDGGLQSSMKLLPSQHLACDALSAAGREGKISEIFLNKLGSRHSLIKKMKCMDMYKL